MYFNEFSTEKIIHKGFNPLREFEEEFIDGPILDIGCGQSNFILEYITSGRTLYAVDSEQAQLDLLRRRLKDYAPLQVANCQLLNATFLEDPLPDTKYSVIISTNLLHFFTFEKAKEAIASLQLHMVPGSIILVTVHSEKHSSNNPDDPNRHSYFKHYYSEADMNILFPSAEFELLYFATVKMKHSILFKKFIEKWLDAYLPLTKRPAEEIATERKRYLKELDNDNADAQIVCMYRKRSPSL